MAELNSLTRSKAAQVAGKKTSSSTVNRQRVAIIDTEPNYLAPQVGDTAGTAIVLPAGSRILCPVVVSNAANAAGALLSVGLRNPTTGVAIDPTAIVNAAAITAAGTAQLATGTKLNNGQHYILPEDAEIYLTFAGANGQANVPIRIEVGFVTP